jgi:hypothetical protein
MMHISESQPKDLAEMLISLANFYSVWIYR